MSGHMAPSPKCVIRIPPERLALIDAAAEARSMTRSAYLLWCEDEVRNSAIRHPFAGASVRDAIAAGKKPVPYHRPDEVQPILKANGKL